MKNQQPTIIGAGLAGLIAAHAWPRARVIESAPAPAQLHKALLRFRNDSVAKLTGIEFKRVLVRKGVYSQGRFVAPDIRLANQYAQKCLGRLVGDRSIWKTESVERFIAPDDFYERLIDNAAGRITWGQEYDFGSAPSGEVVVSTAPLPVTLRSVGLATELKFERAPIHVQRFHIEGADVYQTVYFPDPDLSVYRASMTGSTLIVEAMDEGLAGAELAEVLEAFGITKHAEALGAVKQSYGKIAPVNDAARKGLLFRLTNEYDIYSLGRFATWRNILLDDIVDDIVHVKALLRSDSAYELRKAQV